MNLIIKHMWTKTSRIALSLFILILLLPSCSQKHIIMIEGQPGQDETLVTLSLALPGNVAPKTRSLTTAQEDAVDNLWVLAFEANGGNYSYRAKCMKEGANYNVKLRTGNWDLVLVANAENILANKASLLTTTNNKATVLNGLTLEHKTKWNATPGSSEYVSIPMCSDPQELVNKTIAEQSPQMTVGPVALYRMLARVNVALGSKGGVDAKDNFAITSVHFYNRNTQGYLAPDRTAAGEDKAKLHDFPTGSYGVSNVLEYKETEIVSGTSCTNEIYVSEVNNTSAMGLALTTRPCLVVGGIYNGEPNYYRVDFSTGAAGSETYLDILRNHSYNINISAVSGPGYPSPEEAFNSQPVNIEVTIVPWDDGKMNDVIFDGQYGLGVNCKEFTLFKDALSDQDVGGVNELLALTTYEGDWTVTVKNSDKLTNATASTDAKWLKVKAVGSGSEAYALTASGNTMQRFFIFTAPNTSGVERTAYIHVKVKKIVQEIKVTQTTKAKTSLLLKSGADEVTELLWDNRNHDATHSLTAVWNPIDKQCTIETENTANREFRYELPATGLGTITTAGGSQKYSIKPQPITSEDPNYPFVNRSSVETFTITYGETAISKSVILRQINYALLTTGFPSKVFPNVQNTATVRCNTDWTVTATVGAGLLDSFTPSGVANTTEDSNNFKYKFKTGQYGKVTFTFKPKVPNMFTDVSVVVKSVAKPTGIPASTTYADVLSMDEDGNLNLDGKGQVLYFKWGSLIGLSTDPNISGESADVIVYKPAKYVTPFTTWAAIPYGNGATFPAQELKDGIGDPCKLACKGGVGKGVGDYKTPSGNPFPGFPTGDINNGTTVGNVRYTWNANGGSTLTNLATGTFNLTDDALEVLGATMVLPAAGYRHSPGTVYGQGTYGYCWSSTPNSDAYGFSLLFSSISANSYSSSQSSGLPVRCVRTFPPSLPAYPGVIGYDPETKKLNLDGKGVMVYFKFGSVVAMYSGLNGDRWSSDVVAFNPTNKSFDTYASIPYGDPTSLVITSGLGDPCKLIGYKANEIPTKPKIVWRLPTLSENQQVSLNQTTWVTSGSSHSDPTPRNGHTFSGLNKGSNYSGDEIAWDFLPAAGHRNYSSGAVSSQGSYSYYWSSTPYDNTYGYYLYFESSSANPSGYNFKSSAVAVRCVSQP